MEDPNKQSEPVKPNPTPAQPPQAPVAPRQKIIQPSKAFLEEIKTNPISTAPNVGKAPEGAKQPVIPPTQTASLPQNDPTTSANNIYPNVVDPRVDPSINKPPISDGNLNSLTFENGKSAGISIFFYQIIAGLVVGAIFYFIFRALESSSGNNSNFKGLIIAIYVEYLINIILALYIPYKVVSSTNAPDPFWIALTGSSAIGLIDIVLIYLIIYKLVYYDTILRGHSNDILIAIVLFVVTIVIIYQVYKFVFGYIFKLYGKLHSKKLIKIVGVSILTLIVLSLLIHGYSAEKTRKDIEKSLNVKTQITYQNNNNNSKVGPLSDPVPTAYMPQTFHAHDFNVSFEFDPNYNATISYRPAISNSLPENSSVDIRGMGLSSEGIINVNIDRSVNPANFRIDPTKCHALNVGAETINQQAGTFMLNDNSYAICSTDGLASGNLETFVKSDNNWYHIIIGPTGPNSKTANTIFNSLKIN
jgi:hypothetical protein